ncbi:MAG: META domain-containing protein [Pseudomonadota bacterium]
MRKPWSSSIFLTAAALLTGCGDKPPAAAEPEGDRWLLTAIGTAAMPTDGAAWLRFDDDNQLVGSTGCNSFNAAYRRNASSLYVSALALTRKACPEPQAATEQHFVAALEAAVSVTIDGERMTIESEAPNGQLAFNRSGASR